MSKLLLNDNPLIILPTLAANIGLNEAIFIQQIHYWILKSTTQIDGAMWTYNTYDELQIQFPFWSIRTIKTIVKNCKEKGYLFVEHHSQNKRDKTNYYRINYGLLDTHNSCYHSADVALSDSATLALPIVQELHDVYSSAKTTTETTTENKNNIKSDLSFKLMIDKLQINAPRKSLVKYSDKAKELFLVNEDSPEKIMQYYLRHQEESEGYSKKFENFMLDYDALVKDMKKRDQQNKSNLDLSEVDYEKDGDF